MKLLPVEVECPFCKAFPSFPCRNKGGPLVSGYHSERWKAGIGSRFGPCISFVDRIDGGIVVEFSDGKTVLYSASLLHSVISQAEELEKTNDAET